MNCLYLNQLIVCWKRAMRLSKEGLICVEQPVGRAHDDAVMSSFPLPFSGQWTSLWLHWHPGFHGLNRAVSHRGRGGGGRRPYLFWCWRVRVGWGGWRVVLSSLSHSKVVASLPGSASIQPVSEVANDVMVREKGGCLGWRLCTTLEEHCGS